MMMIDDDGDGGGVGDVGGVGVGDGGSDGDDDDIFLLCELSIIYSSYERIFFWVFRENVIIDDFYWNTTEL